MPRSFCCETCDNSWANARSLSKHYQKFPDHRKSEVKNGGSAVLDSPGAVCAFLSVSDYHRKSRLRELCRQVSQSDVEGLMLLILVAKFSLLSAFKLKCISNPERNDIFSKDKVLSHMKDLLKQLNSAYNDIFHLAVGSFGYVKQTNSDNIKSTRPTGENTNSKCLSSRLFMRPVQNLIPVPSLPVIKKFGTPVASLVTPTCEVNVLQCKENVQNKWQKKNLKLLFRN